jgi:hypothetical protein
VILTGSQNSENARMGMHDAGSGLAKRRVFADYFQKKTDQKLNIKT